MSRTVQKLLAALAEYERTDPESRGLELRLNLAEIVIRSLRQKGWSQRDLAVKASLKESFISRIVHSNANCTLDTAGKLLFHLGVMASITEDEPNVAEAKPDVFTLRYVPETGKSKTYTRKDASDAESAAKSQEYTKTSAYPIEQEAAHG